MAEKEFIFNVIVTKLELRNEWNTSENAVVKFEWGDDPEFSFEMGRDRISRLEFDELYNIEFKRNVDELIEKLETTQFRLTVYERKEKTSADDSATQADGAPIPSKDGAGNNAADIGSVAASEGGQQIVGQSESRWPIKLIQSVKSNEFITTPFTEQYALQQAGKQVGNISLSILLHFKCEESPRKFDQSIPFVDQNGMLEVFKEIEPNLNPNDIFFVIGSATSPAPMTSNLLGNCGGKDQCPAHFEADQYRFVQGTLVEDCSGMGGCGSPVCCQTKGDMDICNEVLDELNAKPVAGACCLDPCEKIFGSIGGLYGGPTCTDLNLACHAEFHTIECTLQRSKKLKRRKKVTRCWSRDNPKKGKRTNDQIIRDILKNDPYEQRKKQILYPHTCPTPQLLAPAEPVQPRRCPVCCEDISWVPLYGTCPKCGFAPKIITPLEEKAYDENKTAQQILDHWKEETAKFRKEQKISKVGACYCTPRNECLNCQLRNFSRRRRSSPKIKRNNYEDKLSEVSGEGDEEGERGETNRIIDDFLPKSVNDENRRSNYKRLDYTIPSIKRIIKWCKKKTISKAGQHFFDGGFSGSESASIYKNSDDISPPNYRKRRDLLQSGYVRSSISSESMPRKTTQGRDNRKQKKHAQNSMKRKARYNSNDEYPGVVLGHKCCVGGARKIPRYMGWLWSASIDGRRRGWRPGAVRRETHRIMKYFLEGRIHPIELLEEKSQASDVDASNRPRRIKEFNLPTLRVTKRDGQFHITLQPVFDPTKSYDRTNKQSIPIEFVIEKEPMEIMRRQMKSRLKRMGFKSCTCGKLIYHCECREELDRENLENAFDNLCQEMCAPQLRDTLYFSDTTKSESEIEIEFSPPAAINRQSQQRKPLAACAETQCNAEDIKMFPVTKSVCEYTPNEFMSRVGYPCGGISKLPPCRSPHATTDTSKKNVDKTLSGDRHNKTSETSKPENQSRLLKTNKDKSDGDDIKKSESKPKQKKSASSNKIQKPGKNNKSSKATKIIPNKPKDPQLSGPSITKPVVPADKENLTDDDDKTDDKRGKSDTKPQAPNTTTTPGRNSNKKPEIKPLGESRPSKLERQSHQKSSERRSKVKYIGEKQKDSPPSRPNISRLTPVRPFSVHQSKPTDNKKPTGRPGEEWKKTSVVSDRRPPGYHPKTTADSDKRPPIGNNLTSKKPSMVIAVHKKTPCPDMSLMHVRFKPHECHEAAALACPADSKVQKDNDFSLLRMLSV